MDIKKTARTESRCRAGIAKSEHCRWCMGRENDPDVGADEQKKPVHVTTLIHSIFVSVSDRSDLLALGSQDPLRCGAT